MPKITEMYAYISEDTGPDDEGVVAFYSGGVWTPMVGADMARAESLRPMAEAMAQTNGLKIQLVKFTNREVIEEIGGQSK